MKRFVSPRQAALSMGVSESSLKRWCDRGAIEMRRTAGGHRKIPVSSVVRFLRENRRELLRPEVIGLPNRLSQTAETCSTAVDQITSVLTRGDTENFQQIVFGFFLSGKSLAQICDELLAPALSLIGDHWNYGDVEIFEEHRAVEMTVRLLHELRVALEPVKKSAPVAIGGTAEGDGYGLPTQMIELALLEAGWKAMSLGTSLPFSTLMSAIQKNEPKLFWLSVSTIDDDQSLAQDLAQFDMEASKLTSFFVGGRALTTELRTQLKCATHCEHIQQLVQHAERLRKQHLNN